MFFLSKYLTAIVTRKEIMAAARFPYLLDNVSETKSLLSSFEQHEDELLF